MNRLQKPVETYIFIGTLAVSVMMIIAVFSNLLPFDLDNYFNSDGLYLPSLYRDLFIDGNGLRGWNTSPSPGFFPDMLLYFVCMFVFNDFYTATFVFAIVQYLIILLLVATIFKMLIPDHALIYASVSNIFMLMFFLVAIYSNDFTFTSYLLSNAFHLGAFVMALLCTTLTIYYLKHQNKSYKYWLVAFSILAIASDRLMIIMFLAPFLVISIIYGRIVDRKKYSQLFVIFFISLIAGILAFWMIRQSGYIHLTKPHKLLELSNSVDSFMLLMSQTGTYLAQFNFKSLIILLSLASFGMICYIFIRDFFIDRNKRTSLTTIYSLYSILFTVFVFGAPVLSGSYTGWDTLRYNIGAYYLSVINIGFIVYWISKQKQIAFLLPKRIRQMVVVMAVIALAAGLFRFSSDGLKHYFNYYPEVVKEIDEIATRENLTLGVGNYWLAKYTTMFTRKGVVIHPVFDPISPFYHTINENCFYTDDAVYNFIVLNRFINPEAYKKIFGNDNKIITMDHAKVVVVKPFRFVEKELWPFFAESNEY